MNKKALYDLSYGMYSIGVMDNDRKCGCIVNTVFQITSQDPLIAISMNYDNYTCELIKKNQRFSVSMISEETNPNVISKLGFVSGKDKDKWEGIPFEMMDGLPILKDKAVSHLICEVEQMITTSTHYIFLAKVVDAIKDNEASPMTYSYYHNVVKGKAPKNAPTYQEEKTKDKWVCTVCGYVYDGPDFEAEPDDYVCPICNAPKSLFEKQ